MGLRSGPTLALGVESFADFEFQNFFSSKITAVFGIQKGRTFKCARISKLKIESSSSTSTRTRMLVLVYMHVRGIFLYQACTSTYA